VARHGICNFADMKEQRPYRPKDTNQLAKYIVELATGQREEVYEDKSLDTVKPKKKKKAKGKR